MANRLKKIVEFLVPRLKIILAIVCVFLITRCYWGSRKWSGQAQRPSKVVFLCEYSAGQMGNIMFAYASMFGVAKSKNMTPSHYEKNNVIYEYFKHPTAVRNYDRCQGFTRYGNVQTSAFNSRDVAFSNRNNTTMNGYYQSWKYFKDSFDGIRKEFTFKDRIQNEARDAIRNATSRFHTTAGLTYVTVHVRRSKIVDKKRMIKYGFISPGVNFYKKAMDICRRKYKPVVFIVVSDRIHWAKRYLNSSDVVFVEGHKPAVDMCVISQGNHTIMSVGTFGWWGSFLANGDTIAYKHQAKAGSVFRKQFSDELADFFLPHWTLLDK